MIRARWLRISGGRSLGLRSFSGVLPQEGERRRDVRSKEANAGREHEDAQDSSSDAQDGEAEWQLIRR